MDTMQKYGLKKSQAILLFTQMLLTILLLVASVYLLIFVISNGLGAWMIVSYIFITLSILAIIVYSIAGYKHGRLAYQLAIIPFLGAIFVNILLPSRNTFQVAVLAILFALTFVFLLKQDDAKFNQIIAISMVAVSLVFSCYSAVNADTQFLGEVSTNWPTYVAMYLSIFIPTIMSGTFALTCRVHATKQSEK